MSSSPIGPGLTRQPVLLVRFLCDAPPPQIYCRPSGLGVWRICSEGVRILCKVDYLVAYLIVVYDDETYIRVAECMTLQKGLHATVTFIF